MRNLGQQSWDAADYLHGGLHSSCGQETRRPEGLDERPLAAFRDSADILAQLRRLQASGVALQSIDGVELGPDGALRGYDPWRVARDIDRHRPVGDREELLP